MSGNGDPAGFFPVLILAMTSFLCNRIPSVSLYQSDDFTDFQDESPGFLFTLGRCCTLGFSADVMICPGSYCFCSLTLLSSCIFHDSRPNSPTPGGFPANPPTMKPGRLHTPLPTARSFTSNLFWLPRARSEGFWSGFEKKWGGIFVKK